MSTPPSLSERSETRPDAPARIQQHRRYLMCRPEHFTVSYRINPWMEPAKPTDTAKALAQWQTLYDTYVALGHEVELIDPVPGLPDMVYTANGGFVIDGRALGVRFRVDERRGEEREGEQRRERTDAGDEGRSRRGAGVRRGYWVDPGHRAGEGDIPVRIHGDGVAAGLRGRAQSPADHHIARRI